MIGNAVVTDAAPSSEASQSVLRIDTTRGSFLHHQRWLTGRIGSAGQPSATRAYVVTISVTYLPLAIASLLSPLPLATPSPTLHLPLNHPGIAGGSNC
jgi:hypothetical protein